MPNISAANMASAPILSAGTCRTAATTFTVALPLLLAVLISVVVVVPLAVNVNSSPVCAENGICNVTVKLTVCPGFMVPRLQGNPPEQGAEMEIGVAPAGSTLAKLAFSAGALPWLLIVIV